MTHGVSQLREEWRVARSAHAELELLRMPRVNVLITGTGGVIDSVLETLLPDLREPIGRWCPGEQLLLPPPRLIGTMVLQGVDGMPWEDQRQLLAWLELASGRTQVVSTTSASLFPLVEAGVFIDTLYYRLNVVCVDATA